jgi:hypothetical protein
MMRRNVFVCCMLGMSAVLVRPVHAGGGLSVVSVSPSRHALNASTGATISVTFDRPVKRTSIVPLESFWAFGRWSGTIAGSFEYSNADQTVTLRPDHPFSAGETVMVILSHDIEGVDNTTLRAGGYSWQFWTRTAPATLEFQEVQRVNVRSNPGVRVRAYGGFASDVNGDQFLDLSIINEDTADVRVLLNQGDGAGTFDPFLTPPTAVGDRASPNEPGDFNRDGIVDFCVANINDNTISVLLGNGDGSFQPQQLITVGATPRGVAVLDVDGDGDMDIVNANAGGLGNMSLLLNDGNGIFGLPTFFEGGGTNEWALAAADMNDDGLLDLVIGCQGSGTIVVQEGVGDGTFSFVTSEPSGGVVWMLVCGDVNGDGTEDVAVVNSSTNRGAILFGDGTGQLGTRQLYTTDPFPLATDLGDLDGDGDLDWVTSSFSGDWFLFENTGTGSFVFREEFIAPQASSCALLLDIDNDRDLDLALIDELSDDIIIMANIGSAPVPAASTWSLIVFALLLCILGSAVIVRSRCAGFVGRT